jgi:hypothetical protein
MDLAHAGHEAVEAIAAAVLVLGGAIFLARAYRTRPARHGPATSLVSPAGAATAATTVLDTVPSVARSLVQIMAGLSFGAAFVHLVAAPSHYLELGDLGAGFVAAAVLQGAWAVRALSGLTPRIVVVGVVLNAGILVAWAWTRTVGLPLGPFVGPEPVGYPDAACAAFEVALVALLAVRMTGLDRRIDVGPVARSLASIAVIPTVGLVVVLASLALVAIANGLDHGALPGGVPIGHQH